MGKMYWFTDDYGEIVCNDYYGSEKGAEQYVRKFMDKGLIDCDVYINCGDDIVGVVFL